MALVVTGCSAANSSGTGDGDDNPYGLMTPGVILSATSGDQPYFTTVENGGEPEGFLIDLNAEITKRLGLTIEYKQTPTAGEIPGLTSGQFDMVTGGFGVTDKREEAVNFSTAIYWDTIALLAPKDTTMSAFEDMKGKRIGVVTGSIQVEFLKNNHPDAIPVLFQGTNAAVSALNSGSVDGFVWSGVSMKPYIDQYDSLDIAYSEPVDHATSVMFQKSNHALTNAYNEQLETMAKDGSFKELYDKYFGDLPVPEPMTEIYPNLAD
ncbi:substrate-binding periplasmic protein [Paramicrobacterium chengjingii]|uniref:Amino acid ABC transporter substrate-binding protein n=1 Tax=Paramicrobacterium chengjingii TaxID=2769067 RepID=A0ABX6YKU2_9MICO|nr:transporter substrate-binding domain-containing protein [Microbacterium chengjingii]QPZ39280.1 amino acid ABC transporter substrate-binding protein [Microbacterium chengjingii]